ncbi:MAG: hypothetical protein II232_04945, partial [Spirochaetaceae bacterium]|nr:hypothetical protein [Spirochaetaceae bacterium]
GTRDGTIGTKNCHYEFVFHDKNTLCLEVHFENANNCSNFEQIVRYYNNLQFREWGIRHRRITSEEYQISINDAQIVQKAIKLLKRLHEAIGEELRQIIQTITPINQPTLLLNDNNNVVRTIHYKPRSREKATEVDSIHGNIQDRLKQELENSRKYANVYLEGYFENLGYRIDLVGVKQNNTHDIFEVKPYPSATECIREALGQILHYYHLLKKGKYKIGKLVIVGPAELNDNDSNFLKTIQQSLNGITLEYRRCPIN